MAELRKVAVTLPDRGEPTKTDVRDIIGTFLTEEWPFADPEVLNLSYDATCTNPHCVVERPNLDSKQPREPLKVFIKFHNQDEGVLEVFQRLLPNKQEEALLSHEYGQSGQGAKVYGFFETKNGTFGRIDEFLDARNLEPNDVEDADIREDIARGFATFHAMKISSPQQPQHAVQAYYEAIKIGLNKYHKMEKLKTLANESGVNIDKLVDYGFVTRLQKVVDKVESINAKPAWCIHDVQFMNVMVRNKPQGTESRTVLIDFEIVMRNYRGFDIGGHYMQKLFKWFDEESKVANCRPYTDEEKKHFCEQYAKTWNALTGDSDTGDQVYMEAELGYMLAITFDVHNMLCFMDSAGDKDPLNLEGLNKLLDEFQKQYAKLGFGDS